jgi:hypothetical protein
MVPRPVKSGVAVRLTLGEMLRRDCSNCLYFREKWQCTCPGCFMSESELESWLAQIPALQEEAIS